MKRPTRMVFLGVWLGAAAVQAQTQTAPGTPPDTSTSGQQGALTGPQVQAEILAIDAAGKTITVRESAAGDASDAAAKSASAATLPVEGKAIARLGVAKAGDRVTLICAGAGAVTASTSTTNTDTTSSATSGTDAAGASSSPSTAGSPADPATGTSGSAGTESTGDPGPAGTTSAPGTSGATSRPETAGSSSSSASTAASGADASSQSALHATCGSVVEIAKARATTTSPQQ